MRTDCRKLFPIRRSIWFPRSFFSFFFSLSRRPVCPVQLISHLLLNGLGISEKKRTARYPDGHLAVFNTRTIRGGAFVPFRKLAMRHQQLATARTTLAATVIAALSFSACMFMSKECATSSSVLSVLAGATPIILLILTVVRNHASTIDKLQKTHEAQVWRNQKHVETVKHFQIAEKNKEFERSLEDERARREAEILAMNNRHQKVVMCLDEKIAEAEKQCEQLNADKKALQAALANDCDHRNQMLTKEISSLQTALEMKSAEMKELRQKNQNVSDLSLLFVLSFYHSSCPCKSMKSHWKNLKSASGNTSRMSTNRCWIRRSTEKSK